MIDIVVKLLAVCLTVALLSLVLKKSNPELAVLLTVAVLILAILSLTERVEEVMEMVHGFWEQTGLSVTWVTPLIKALPIALISHLGAELCRDASQNALAVLVETTGTLCALIAILPLFKAAWELLNSL
ncbi:MAG: stage III sporulation protein AD [Oscillospiraceae bacterium]|nr:stage III sporulation protein AD [Oscillospiraceae bacterium]